MVDNKTQPKITRRKFLANTGMFVAGSFVMSAMDCISTPESKIENKTERKKMKKIISTKKAPGAIGPYSQAVLVNGFLYTSGQIAINPESGELVLDTIQHETHQVMKNLEALLTEAGADFSHVVKTSIFLQSMQDFQAVNEVYASYFNADFPARETVEVGGLPKGVNVEISMIAVVE